MHWPRQLTTEAELGALSDLVLAWGEPNFALKTCQDRRAPRVVLPRAYFPLPDAVAGWAGCAR